VIIKTLRHTHNMYFKMSSNDNLVPTSLIVIWCTKNQKIIAYLNININYNPNNLKLVYKIDK